MKMKEFENHQVDEFWAAIQIEIEKSKEKTMRCCICTEPTRERAVGFLPGKPARPFIFAACELCQSQPEWEEEANKVLVNYLNSGDDSDETSNDDSSL